MPAAVFIGTDGNSIWYIQSTDDDGSSWLPAELVELGPTTVGLPTLRAFGSPQHACVAWRLDSQIVKFARKN